MIAIVDYGVGNLGSILNMFKKVNVDALVTSDPAAIDHADRLLLPGVGAFDRGMENLRASGLVPHLRQAVDAGKPLLGICLGMQLLTEGSEEGNAEGLGWIPGRSLRFRPDDERLKVPHMGWNVIHPTEGPGLLKDMREDARFYFLHSYYVLCTDRADAIATTRYGIEFDSVIGRDNVIGVQFHPEKSHRFGMQLLENFASLVPV